MKDISVKMSLKDIITFFWALCWHICIREARNTAILNIQSSAVLFQFYYTATGQVYLFIIIQLKTTHFQKRLGFYNTIIDWALTIARMTKWPANILFCNTIVRESETVIASLRNVSIYRVSKGGYWIKNKKVPYRSILHQNV